MKKVFLVFVSLLQIVGAAEEQFINDLVDLTPDELQVHFKSIDVEQFYNEFNVINQECKILEMSITNIDYYLDINNKKVADFEEIREKREKRKKKVNHVRTILNHQMDQLAHDYSEDKFDRWIFCLYGMSFFEDKFNHEYQNDNPFRKNDASDPQEDKSYGIFLAKLGRARGADFDINNTGCLRSVICIQNYCSLYARYRQLLYKYQVHMDKKNYYNFIQISLEDKNNKKSELEGKQIKLKTTIYQFLSFFGTFNLS